MTDCDPAYSNPDEVEALYPEGQSPEHRLTNFSAICSYGVTPLVVEGGLRWVLIQHFSDSRNILNSSLRRQIETNGGWTNNQNTGIIIESISRWTPELAHGRPAIILKTGSWTWQRQGIGNMSGGDYVTGASYFAGMWQGSQAFFAIAKNGAEALQLAIELYKCLLLFSAEISKTLTLHGFEPVTVGEIAELKEATETYVVPVVFRYNVAESWLLQPDAPRLKRIIFSAANVLADY